MGRLVFIRFEASAAPRLPRGVPAVPLLGIFASPRPQLYGLALVVGYAALLFYLWRVGLLLVGKVDVAVRHDFACFFAARVSALHDDVAAICTPQEFVQTQKSLVGVGVTSPRSGRIRAFTF